MPLHPSRFLFSAIASSLLLFSIGCSDASDGDAAEGYSETAEADRQYYEVGVDARHELERDAAEAVDEIRAEAGHLASEVAEGVEHAADAVKKEGKELMGAAEELEESLE